MKLELNVIRREMSQFYVCNFISIAIRSQFIVIPSETFQINLYIYLQIFATTILQVSTHTEKTSYRWYLSPSQILCIHKIHVNCPPNILGKHSISGSKAMKCTLHAIKNEELDCSEAHFGGAFLHPKCCNWRRTYEIEKQWSNIWEKVVELARAGAASEYFWAGFRRRKQTHVPSTTTTTQEVSQACLSPTLSRVLPEDGGVVLKVQHGRMRFDMWQVRGRGIALGLRVGGRGSSRSLKKME